MSENNPSEETTGERRTGFPVLMAHINRNKVTFALWCTRVATIFFTFNYLIPIFGYGPSMFSKALLANAATSALRLHQRLPRVQLSREFFAHLFVEDSAHYLLYSLIFLYSAPITWVLVPIFLFALLHISSYSLELIELLGPNALSVLRMGIGVVEINSANLLRTIALSEIFLFPLLFINLFWGRTSLMVLFVYYRFLTLRYASRRNPYSKNAFYELRTAVETFIQRPNCPEPVRNIANRMIALVCRLAPPTSPQQAAQ